VPRDVIQIILIWIILTTVNIGIICYASIGGSGIVATELGKGLASRGHHVHVLSSDTPFRLGEYQPGLSFHRVEAPNYPLFREPQYLLALANKLVQVSRDERLDIIHAHYAVPHATAGYLARQILGASHGGKNGDKVPRVITTLHGTDITLLGADRSYKEIVTFSIAQSDGVTAVSESLKADTYRELGQTCEIRVIPNFVDGETARRTDRSDLRATFAPSGEKLVIHVSNFRPVKRVTAAVEVFRQIHAVVPSRMLMVGDGPDLAQAAEQARAAGLGDAVRFLGDQEQVVHLLSVSDLFLMPSAQESFGLAALEAMACEVPVVASRVGGVPELVEDGVTGILCPPDDLASMANASIRLLTDDKLHSRMAQAGRKRAVERFADTRIVPMYEAYYDEILAVKSHS
jgi:N-acetyl-alpha-D-glucosaminyl L-malate synthase BshA